MCFACVLDSARFAFSIEDCKYSGTVGFAIAESQSNIKINTYINDDNYWEQPAADPVRCNRFLRDSPPHCSGKPLSRY